MALRALKKSRMPDLSLRLYPLRQKSTPDSIGAGRGHPDGIEDTDGAAPRGYDFALIMAKVGLEAHF